MYSLKMPMISTRILIVFVCIFVTVSRAEDSELEDEVDELLLKLLRSIKYRIGVNPEKRNGMEVADSGLEQYQTETENEVDEENRRFNPNREDGPAFNIADMNFSNFRWEEDKCKRYLIEDFKKIYFKCFGEQAGGGNSRYERQSYYCWWCAYCHR